MSAPLSRPGEDHVLIVGAGLIGLGVGWQLARRGCRVTIVEALRVGERAASTAAAGMLAATAEVNFEEEQLLALNHRSASLYASFVEELEAAAGMSVDYRTRGSLVIGLDRDDTEALQRLLDYQRRHRLEASLLSGEEARELEPALAPGVHSAVLCPRDYQVNPVLLLEALRRAFLAAGGELLEQAPVERLLVVGSCVRGVVLESGEPLSGDRVLLATGAWTRRLGGVEKKVLPRIRPVVGQMLALDMSALPSPLCEHVLRAPDAYLVPRSDGELILGASMEERGFDGRQRAGHVFELLRGAWETLPGIYELPLLRTWTGFRPMSLHNEPVLGPSPDIENLWFATGHGRNGVLLTAVTALELAPALMRGELSDVLRPFAA